MKEYKGPKRYKGVDDLIPELPYRNMDYGAEGCLSRYGKGNPYMKYLFTDIVEDDGTAIEKEILRRKEVNKEYIESLHADGTYGTELPQVPLFIEENPLYDSPFKGGGDGPTVSYRYDILGFDNIKRE
jgi:hypothetical protein